MQMHLMHKGAAAAPLPDFSKLGQDYMAARATQPVPWHQVWRRRAMLLGVGVYLLLLALGPILTLVFVGRMIPTLRVANGAMTKIDIIYDALNDVVKLVCSLPVASFPPDLQALIPLICNHTRAS